MDKVIKQSWRARNRKKIFIGAFITIMVSVMLRLVLSSPLKKLQLDKIRIGTVEYGEFQEIVMANGTVEPKRTVLIDANEGGTVSKILVEEGQLVKAGDVLLVLTNESLLLDYMQRETQMVEQINNLRNTRIALRQNLRSTEDLFQDFSKQFNQVERQYAIDSALYVANGIAKQLYDDSKTNYDFLDERVSILEERKNDDLSYQKRPNCTH